MNRMDRRKREVRDRILGAAFDLFLSQGVSATTIEEICERADVANRTFFNHFATRQDMMRALAESRLLNLHDVVVDRRTEPVPARLVGLFDDIATALVKSSDTYREVIGEMLASSGYGIQRGFALARHLPRARQGRSGSRRGQRQTRRADARRHHRRGLDRRDRQLDCGQDVFARDRPARPRPCAVGSTGGQRRIRRLDRPCDSSTATSPSRGAGGGAGCRRCPDRTAGRPRRRGGRVTRAVRGRGRSRRLRIHAPGDCPVSSRKRRLKVRALMLRVPGQPLAPSAPRRDAPAPTPASPPSSSRPASVSAGR